MNQELKDKCELFIRNRDIIKNHYLWEDDAMSVLGSMVFTGKNMTVDVARLKECENLLKRKEGVFSDFRGNLKMPLITNMAMADNAESYFNGVKEIYKILNKHSWFGSEYKILAAMAIYTNVPREKWEETIERTNEIYQGMKKEHPFLTSEEDVSFAAMLACTDIDIAGLLVEMEKCYGLLKNKFFSGNSVQSLSHVLALDSSYAEAKCEKVMRIFDGLKASKRSYGTGYELATLGALSMLELSVESIVREIVDADDFLKKQKGFGFWGIGNAQRVMYAALLVMDTYMPPADVMHNAALSGSLAMIIAQEVAMVAVIAAMTVNTTSNN